MTSSATAKRKARQLIEAIEREVERFGYGERRRIQKILKTSANKLPRALERGNIDLVTFLGYLDSLNVDSAAFCNAVLAAVGEEDRKSERKATTEVDLYEIDKLDFLYQNNDPDAEPEILQALQRTGGNASICGVAGSLYFALSRPERARRYFRKAMRRARKGWQLAEIFGRQVSMAIADGELSYARSVAERGYLMARTESREIRGRLAHQLGLAHGHSSSFGKAKSFYTECLGLVEPTSYHWASARLGLGILAMKSKDIAEAHRQLVSLEKLKLPSTLAAYWFSVMAEVAAARGDYSTAASLQREATGHFGDRRLANVGVSTAINVLYLLKSGQLEEARRIAVEATRLVQLCGRKDRATAVVLSRLVSAGLSAELSVGTTKEFLSQLKQVNHTGQETHRSDRSPQVKK